MVVLLLLISISLSKYFFSKYALVKKISKLSDLLSGKAGMQGIKGGGGYMSHAHRWLVNFRLISSAGNRWKISARLIIQIFDRLIDYNRLLLMLICPLNSVQYMAVFPLNFE